MIMLKSKLISLIPFPLNRAGMRCLLFFLLCMSIYSTSKAFASPRDISSLWRSVASYRPSEALQTETLKYNKSSVPLWGESAYENWYVERIENAEGPLLLDLFSIEIDRLPTINGEELTADKLLEYIRLNLDQFIPKDLASFKPYNMRFFEQYKQSNQNAVGSYVSFFYYPNANSSMYGQSAQPVAEDNYLLSLLSNSSFMLSSVYATGHRDHSAFTRGPGNLLLGNRIFKVDADGDGLRYITAGAFRTRVSQGYRYNGKIDIIYSLWSGHQDLVSSWINSNGGNAKVLSPSTCNLKWRLADNPMHNPTTRWVDILESGERGQRYPAGKIATESIEGGDTCTERWSGQNWKDVANEIIATSTSPETRNLAITSAYAKLYLKNPHIKWSGMAAFASALVGHSLQLPITLPATIVRGTSCMVSSLLKFITFGWFESTTYCIENDEAFLVRKLLADGNVALFKDFYWQGLAFDYGGTSEVVNYSKAIGEEIHPLMLEAWTKIELGATSSNNQQILEGNRLLAKYEQTVFLQKEVFDHEPELWLKLSYIASKTHKYFGQYTGIDLLFASPIPGDEVPFPRFMAYPANFGNKNDRWFWVEKSMLPYWEKIEHENNNFIRHSLQVRFDR